MALLSSSAVMPDFNLEWYSGKMDEVRIWDVAKTQAEIRSKMTAYVYYEPNLINHYSHSQGFQVQSKEM